MTSKMLRLMLMLMMMLLMLTTTASIMASTASSTTLVGEGDGGASDGEENRNTQTTTITTTTIGQQQQRTIMHHHHHHHCWNCQFQEILSTDVSCTEIIQQSIFDGSCCSLSSLFFVLFRSSRSSNRHNDNDSDEHQTEGCQLIVADGWCQIQGPYRSALWNSTVQQQQQHDHSSPSNHHDDAVHCPTSEYSIPYRPLSLLSAPESKEEEVVSTTTSPAPAPSTDATALSSSSADCSLKDHCQQRQKQKQSHTTTTTTNSVLVDANHSTIRRSAVATASAISLLFSIGMATTIAATNFTISSPTTTIIIMESI
eukprot:scaffold486_cov79-Cylindrotheca_fusiformis.AAC.6